MAKLWAGLSTPARLAAGLLSSKAQTFVEGIMRGHVIGIVVLIAAISLSLEAQIITGTIQGFVSDQSGAVVPGVTVLVKNLDTNQVRTAVTNESGNYLIPLLPVGRYEVS